MVERITPGGGGNEALINALVRERRPQLTLGRGGTGQTRISPSGADLGVANALTANAIRPEPVTGKTGVAAKLVEAFVGADIRRQDVVAREEKNRIFDDAIDQIPNIPPEQKTLLKAMDFGKKQQFAARILDQQRQLKVRSQERREERDFTRERDKSQRDFIQFRDANARAFQRREKSLDRNLKASITFASQVEKKLQAGKKDEKATFKAASDLRKEFNKRSDNFIEVRNAFQRIQASTEIPSPAGDLSLIFNYMKMLDPRSTVREGEFATVQNTGSVPQRVWGFYNRMIRGERLTDPQRGDFVSKSNDLFQKELGNQKNLIQAYTGIAERNKLPVEDVISQDLLKFPELAGGSGSSTNALTPAQQRRMEELRKKERER